MYLHNQKYVNFNMSRVCKIRILMIKGKMCEKEEFIVCGLKQWGDWSSSFKTFTKIRCNKLEFIFFNQLSTIVIFSLLVQESDPRMLKERKIIFIISNIISDPLWNKTDDKEDFFSLILYPGVRFTSLMHLILVSFTLQ